MMEAVLIFGGGLLGSAHCVGMCGGFVLTLGGTQRSWTANLGRQLLYAAGRICTYASAGAVAGFGGWRLGRETDGLVHVQAILAILAGVLLLAEGAFSAGWLRRPWAHAKVCPGAGGFAALLRTRHVASVFAAGVFNGLLPCGLVYAYLALAASSGAVLGGAGIMLLFGLGTVPLLALTGVGGTLLNLTHRRRLFRIAAWCMLLTGGLSIARGISFWQAPSDTPPTCPFCADFQES